MLCLGVGRIQHPQKTPTGRGGQKTAPSDVAVKGSPENMETREGRGEIVRESRVPWKNLPSQEGGAPAARRRKDQWEKASMAVGDRHWQP